MMSRWNGKVYDILGVGFGPANIALAIALEESRFGGSVLMLERRNRAQWQPDMLLEGSDIQNHACRDLITPRNPRSRYTFLNYLYEHDRLLEHLNLGIEFPLRREYADYISWVAAQFSRWTVYGTGVESIGTVESDGTILIRVTTSGGEEYLARSLVLAPGRTANIPPVFVPHLGPRVFHLTEYLTRLAALAQPIQHLCVVGGSQSSAEIMLDLCARHPAARISNIMRSYGYRLKDTSQFSERAFLPDFIDYYYRCGRESKAQLDQTLQATNYSSVDGDVIRHLYVRMYEERLEGRNRIQLFTCHEILECIPHSDSFALCVREVHTGETREIGAIDAIVLATGFRNLGTRENQERCPVILRELAGELRCQPDGVLQIERDYRLLHRDLSPKFPPVYVNGLCESSHGLGDAGSFSLLSVRAGEICESLLQSLGPRTESHRGLRIQSA